MKFVVVTLTLLLTASTCFAGPLSQEKIILTTQDWAPYQTYESHIVDGFAVATVSCIMEMMDKSYEMRVHPWKHAQELVKEQKAHGFFSASQNGKRDAYATLSEPIADQQWNWYLLKGSSLNPNDTSFKNDAKVTGISGSNMVSWLKDNEYHLTEDNFIDMKSLVEALISEKVDAIYANNLAMRTVVQIMEMSMDDFKSFTTKDKPVGVYWANRFLADNPGFLDKFNSLIGMCR